VTVSVFGEPSSLTPLLYSEQKRSVRSAAAGESNSSGGSKSWLTGSL
jgi:hypothetical protein